MEQIVTWPYRLRKGQACAMDVVNWVSPDKLACPIITNFVIPANDAMDDATRQRFLPYLHRIAGSRSPQHKAARLRIVVLAAARVFAPMALEAAGLDASVLRAIPNDVTYTDIKYALGAAAAEAEAVAAAVVWNAYFSVLDEALCAGPQGEPWSADAVESAVTVYKEAVR